MKPSESKIYQEIAVFVGMIDTEIDCSNEGLENFIADKSLILDCIDSTIQLEVNPFNR